MRHIRTGILIFILNNLIASGVSAQFIQEEPLAFNNHETAVGISFGTSFLFVDLEISLVNYHRISKSFIIQYKPFLGGIRQLYLSDDNNPSHIIHGGGAVGVLIGKKNKFFELDIGGTYLFWGAKHWGRKNKPHILIGHVSYRNEAVSLPFSIGVGFPKGIFISVFI